MNENTYFFVETDVEELTRETKAKGKKERTITKKYVFSIRVRVKLISFYFQKLLIHDW